MKNRIILFLAACFLFLIESYSQDISKIDLSGNWQVTIPAGVFTVKLPGSLAESNVGNPVEYTIARLTPTAQYEEEAIYEKDIDIPASWGNKCVELFMERTRITEVFVNQIRVGGQNSVSTPHVYRICDAFKPGINHLRIVVNNSKKLLPLGNAHIWSDDTQTNWNGILGDFYLRRLDDIDVSAVWVNAGIAGQCDVGLDLRNLTVNPVEKSVRVVVSDSSGRVVAEKQINLTVPKDSLFANISLNVGNPVLWDEYHPYLYGLEVHIQGNTQTKKIRFGFRDFNAHSGKFANNGRTVFLRGKHDAGVFPLTGYASMEKADWLRYFSIAQSYGINHVRFHTWTPPRSAFEAADESGVFLQPEMPVWTTITPKDPELVRYMKAEGRRIMEAYGNHPSFVMFTLGNELWGEIETMGDIVNYFKSIDKRHLYANGTNYFWRDPKPYPPDDFFAAMRHGPMAPDDHTDIRGSFSFSDSDAKGGIINRFPPSTNRDFSKGIQELEIPAVGHETGQYQIYPDFKEIEKYTGVLHAGNFELIKQKLADAGMLSQASDFRKASGALSALCYREDIEMALRTPGFDGFQLLDLQDYPGQGTALVGILDAFMDSKGVIEKEKWREFCNDIVPLALFSKYGWTNKETFSAKISVAHYGEKDLLQEDIVCRLETQQDKLLYEKVFSGRNIIQGAVSVIDSIQIPLNRIKTNQKLRFTVMLKKSGYKNSWDIWAYTPNKRPIQEGNTGKVFVTQNKTQGEKVAATGKPVLYIPRSEDIREQSVGGLFIADFWNYEMFRTYSVNAKTEPSPGTLGILTDPNHPVFKFFPTDFHTNWQWWNIIKHARPVILDPYPEGYKPIVQVVDNIYRNHKLGLIYEEPGVKGKVLVCASDLFAIKNEPEAQALFNSLVNYLENN